MRLVAGQLVSLTGIKSRPELNDRWGVVNCFVEDKCRYAVNVGRSTELVSLKPECLSPVEKATAAEYLEIWPIDPRVVRSKEDIPVSELFGGSPPCSNSEIEFLSHPRKFIKKSRREGWKRPIGTKGYTREALYPDLFIYFDVEDTKSARNQFVNTLCPYPDAGFESFPSDGVRGNAVVIRLEPPRAIVRCSDDPALGGYEPPDMTMAEPKQITVEEMQDALWHFYHEGSCKENARNRDYARTMASFMKCGMPDSGPPDMFTSAYPGMFGVPKF